MGKYLTAIFLLVAAIFSILSTSISEDYPGNLMVSVDPIYITTTIILRFKDKTSLGNATGFFFEDKQKNIFLITNKHVIYGEKYYENPPPQINNIKLVLHTNTQNLSQNEEVKIPLFKNGKKIWLEHTDRNVDVALIPINLDRKKYVIIPLNESVIESSNLEIGFEKIFVMGYPFGWYDNINNLPVTRVGHLSSPFKIPFQNRPIMLGDVETHPGMSGGPVFMKLKDFVTFDGKNRTTHLGSSRTLLVGIHSGQPRWDLIDRNTGQTKTISHSLIHVWFPELILDILNLQVNK